MKHEIRHFLTALTFYTRLPSPLAFTPTEENLSKSIRYFSFIGWIVGAISGIVFIATTFLFSIQISLLFSMLTSIIITGGLHEDGLADVCDGFGGGWKKDKILEIMKDSRIGAYGVLGLVFVFSFKFFVLKEVIEEIYMSLTNETLLHVHGCVTGIFIIVHGFSRWMAASIIFTHSYVGGGLPSKSSLLVRNRNKKDLFVLSAGGMIPFLFFKPEVFLIALPVFILRVFLGRYFSKWIGGYTGDCLGATQQLAEIVCYLSILYLLKSSWKFI